jgi:hypothetical protein
MNWKVSNLTGRFIHAIATASLAAILVAGCATRGADADKPLHIFVLAGQSNMSGRGSVGDIDRTPHPRVFALNANDEWVIAIDPVHFDKPARVGVGPGLAFAKEIAEQNPGIRVGLVPTAVGGSPIETWAPGGYHERTGLHPWDDAVHRIEVAGQAGEIKSGTRAKATRARREHLCTKTDCTT